MALSKAAAIEAVDDEIKKWEQHTCNNIRTAVLPPLPDDDPIIQSAVWLNFGLDMGKNLSLAVSTAASKAALPIWALFKAQELYATYYHQPQVAKTHQMLSQHYDDFKSQIINSVADAERLFMRQSFAEEVIDCLVNLHKDRTFDNFLQEKGVVRDLIRDSGVIVTDDTVIRQTIQTNLGRVAQGILDLYEGTHAAGRNHLLYVSNSSNAHIPEKTSPTAASCHARGIDHAVPEGYTKVDSRDKETMARLYANAYLMDIKHHDFSIVMPCYDTTYARHTSLSQPDVQTGLSQSYKGTIEALIATYQRQQAGHIAKAV